LPQIQVVTIDYHMIRNDLHGTMGSNYYKMII